VPLHGGDIARISLGTTPLDYMVQSFTALILIVAANTSFADFPWLCWLHARDGFLPRQLTHRGDRLVFYAVGVFLAFTLSQGGMVVHWWRSSEASSRRNVSAVRQRRSR
jgi:hypothetical protein